MTNEQAARYIEQRLLDNWGLTPIDINMNVDFTPPDTGTSFIRLLVYNDIEQRKNIGMPAVHRVNGTIAIQIHTPLNTGTRTAKIYAATLAALFRDQVFNCITCRGAQLNAPIEYEGRMTMSVLVPFHWNSDCDPTV